MKTLFSAAAVMLALSTSGALADCGIGCVTLYDQNENLGAAINSQNFDSSLSSYDSAAADDFIVPSTYSYSVLEVDFSGAYSDGSGPASSFNITFYLNKRGHPGRVRYALTSLPCTSAGSQFYCQIPSRPRVILRAGKHYWISITASCDIACGQWGWIENTIPQNDPGVWENPANGWNTGCTSWESLQNCGFGAAADFAFALRGNVY